MNTLFLRNIEKEYTEHNFFNGISILVKIFKNEETNLSIIRKISKDLHLINNFSLFV
jgi:hypothetical protein